MDIIKTLALTVLLLFSIPAFANELSIDLIQNADDMSASAQQAIALGLIEAPDQEWIDEISAYYFGLNVAWAFEDEDQYKAIYAEMEALYEELVEDAIQYEEPEAPKTEL